MNSIKYYTLAFFIGLSCFCFSAAPIFHSVIAEKWAATFENYNKKQKQAFMLGTLYPDIRHLAKVDRDLTHEYTLTIEDIKNTKDPFYKGMRLHSFVDESRKAFLAETNIPSYLSKYPGDKELFLKLLEDEILFPLYGPTGLAPIRYYLNTIDIKELKFNISYTTVRKWHDYLSLCLRYPPSLRFRLLLLDPKIPHGFQTLTMEHLVEYLPKYKTNPVFISYVDNILNYYDNLFTSTKQSQLSSSNHKSLWKKFLDKLSMIKSYLFSVN